MSPTASAPSRLFLAALVLAMALGPISIQMFLPALPVIQDAFGVGAGWAHLALSASMASIAVSTLVWGPLSDRFGRRPMLIAGQLLFLVGSVVCTVAGSLGLLVAGRIVQAAGAAAGLVLARAVVRDTMPIDRLSAVLAYFAMAMAAFPMVAPAIGGLLIDTVGWRAVFGFSVAVGGVSLLAVTTQVRETRVPGEPEGPSAVGGLLRKLREPVFWGYAVAGGFSAIAFFGFISAVPAILRDGMGRPATEYGLWFSTVAGSFIVGNAVAARVSHRVGRDRMVVLGSLAILAAAAGLAGLYRAGFWHPFALFGPAMVLCFGQGLANPNTQAGAVEGDAAVAGAASGLYSFIQTLMAASIAQATGWFSDGTPIPMAFCALAGGLGSLLAVGWVRVARRT